MAHLLGPDLETHTSANATTQAWDQFVTRCPSVHHEQLWAWGQVRSLDGWSPTLLVARADEEIVGGALVLTRSHRRYLKVGYICHAPLVSPSDTPSGEAAQSQLVAALKNFARSRGLTFLVVSTPYQPEALASCLLRSGFTPHSEGLPPSGIRAGTVLLDLSQGEDPLLAGMRITTRYNVRVADRKGITITEGSRADIPVFWRLLEGLCSRRGVSSNVRSIKTVFRLWDQFADSQAVDLRFACYEGVPVAGLLTIRTGTWAFPWRIGWSGAEAKRKPTEALYWSAIRKAREVGCTVFDFNWIDPGEAETSASGGPATIHGGITSFKTGFGGRIIRLSCAFDYFPNSLLRVGMRCVGRAFLGSRTGKRVLRSLQQGGA